MYRNQSANPSRPDISPVEALLRTCSCFEFGGNTDNGEIICSTIPSAGLINSLQKSRSAPQPYYYYYQAVVRITSNGILIYKGDQTTFAASAMSHYGVPTHNKAPTEILWDVIEDVREEHIGAGKGSTRIVFSFTQEANQLPHGITRLLSGFVLDIQRSMVADGILEAVKLMSVETQHERAAACRELLHPAVSLPSEAMSPLTHSDTAQQPIKHMDKLSQRQKYAVELELLELRQKEAAMRADIQHIPREDSRGASHRGNSRSTSQTYRQPMYTVAAPEVAAPAPQPEISYPVNASPIVELTTRIATPSPSVNYPSLSHPAPEVARGGIEEHVRRQIRDDSIQREVLLTSTRGSAPHRAPQLLTSIESHEIANDVSDLLRILEREERDGHRSVSAQRSRLSMPSTASTMSAQPKPEQHVSQPISDNRLAKSAPSPPPAKVAPKVSSPAVRDPPSAEFETRPTKSLQIPQEAETEPNDAPVSKVPPPPPPAKIPPPKVPAAQVTTTAITQESQGTDSIPPLTSKVPPPTKAPPPPPPAKVAPKVSSPAVRDPPSAELEARPNTVPPAKTMQTPIAAEPEAVASMPAKVPPPPPPAKIPPPKVPAAQVTTTAITQESQATNSIPPPTSKVPPPPPTKVPPPPPTKVPPPPPPPAKAPPAKVPSAAAPPTDNIESSPAVPSALPTKAPPSQPSDAVLEASPTPSASGPGSPTQTAPAKGGRIYGVWKELFDAKKGKNYYYNMSTKETKWAMPPEVAEFKSAEQGATVTNIEKGPDGLRICGPWREKAAPDGRSYFVNTETKERTWKVSETPFAT